MRCACNASIPSRACVRADRAPLARDQVRCCSPKQLDGWGYPPRDSCSVWAESAAGSWGCSADKTYAEAETICQAQGARLCTKKELEDDCTLGSGCGFDKQLVWAQKI